METAASRERRLRNGRMRPALCAMLAALGMLSTAILPAQAGRERTPSPATTQAAPLVVGMLREGWPPFETFDDNGTPRGVSVEMLDYVAQRTGMAWTPRYYATWPALYQAACRGEVDLLLSVTPNAERAACLVFSTPYFQAFPVVVTRRDLPAVADLSSLAGRRIAVAREYALSPLIARRFPSSPRVMVDGPRAALRAVAEGRADAFVTNPHTARFIIDEQHLANLRIGSPVAVPLDTLTIAAPQRNSKLLAMISQVIAGMSSLQRNQLAQPWLAARAGTDASGRLPLNSGDRAYLDGLPPIRVAYLEQRPPISFTDSFGKANGYAPTMMRRAAGLLGLQVEFVPFASAAALRQKAESGQFDAIVGLARGSHVGGGYVATMPYSTFPIMLATRADASPIASSSEMKGRTVLVSEALAPAMSTYLDTAGVDTRAVTDARAAMQQVHRGEAAAYLDSLMVVDRLLQREFYGEMKIAGAPRSRDELVILVARGQPRLRTLLDSALASIPAAQQERLRSQWTSLAPYQELSWRLVWNRYGSILIAVALGALAILAWQFRLQREVRRRKALQSLLAQRSAFQQLLIDSSPHPMAAVDAQGDVAASNAAYREAFAAAGPLAGPFVRLTAGDSEEIHGRELLYAGADQRERVGMYWQLEVNETVGFRGRVATLVDVTPLREAERNAKQAQLRLADFTDNLPGTLYQYAVDADGSTAFQYVFGSPRELFGVGAEEIIADEALAVRAVHPQDRAPLRAAIVGASRELRPLSIDFRTCVDGTIRWVRSHAVPSQQAGRAVVWNGYWIDVTDEHRRRQQLSAATHAAEAAMLAKGRFLAVMSHEIRTPLGGVVGLVDVISQTSLTHDQRHLVELLKEASATLAGTIDGVLDFTRLDEGAVAIEAVPTRLRDLLESTVAAMLALMPAAVRITVDCSAQVADAHAVDPARLRQILANLLSNAAKFTHQGSIAVTLDALAITDGRQRLQLEVADTGIGMDAETLASLFAPFAQAAGTHDRYGGSGLGLAISQRIAQLMGGAIEVRSELAKGSSFILHFDADAAALPAVPPRFQGLRIAVAAATAEPLARVLEEEGARRIGQGPVDLQLGDDPLRAGVPRLEAVERPIMGGYQRSGRRAQVSVAPLLRRAVVAAAEAVLDEDADTAPPLPAGSSPVQTAHRRCALLVDDTAINRDVLTLQLDMLGYRCRTAADGNLALEQLRLGRVDVVITDCRMAPMSGYEWVRRFRASDIAGAQDLPILGLSAASDDGRWRDAGMNAFLERPFTLPQLRTVLRQLDPVQEGAMPNSAEDARRPLQALGDRAAVDDLRRRIREAAATALADVKQLQFADAGDRLADWAHATLGALVLLGHNDLTRWMTHSEDSLREAPTLATLAEFADLLSELEQWSQQDDPA